MGITAYAGSAAGRGQAAYLGGPVRGRYCSGMEAGGLGPEPGGGRGHLSALTTFVGRSAEVDEVVGLLGRYRLVTVTGPGGVGKTRLAAEVAARVAARFADGIRLAELASVQDQAQVTAAVAAVLGVRQAPGDRCWSCWRGR